MGLTGAYDEASVSTLRTVPLHFYTKQRIVL